MPVMKKNHTDYLMVLDISNNNSWNIQEYYNDCGVGKLNIQYLKQKHYNNFYAS